jgi:hypothetical protein
MQWRHGPNRDEHHDYADDPKPWVESMHRIAKEVVPHVKDVVAAA